MHMWGALKGLNATNSQHFGTANFPANIAAENSKTSVHVHVCIALYCLYQYGATIEAGMVPTV